LTPPLGSGAEEEPVPGLKKNEGVAERSGSALHKSEMFRLKPIHFETTFAGLGGEGLHTNSRGPPCAVVIKTRASTRPQAHERLSPHRKGGGGGGRREKVVKRKVTPRKQNLELIKNSSTKAHQPTRHTMVGLATFMIVSRSDVPLYEADLGSGPKKDDAAHLHQFVMHAAQDFVEERMWETPSMNLKLVDRFNDMLVGCIRGCHSLPGVTRLVYMDHTGCHQRQRAFANTPY
jgi:hypothetical protein